MINVDSKVKNIYYMLCYSFNSSLLKEKDEATLGDEAFNNIYNLFSLLLCLVLKIQIKKGVYKDYNFESDKLSTIKGKINLNSSFKSNTLVNKKIVCEYGFYNFFRFFIAFFLLFEYNSGNKILEGINMRKNINFNGNSQYKIIAVDDESGVLDTLKVFLNKAGYDFVGITDPMEAIERVKTEK